MYLVYDIPGTVVQYVYVCMCMGCKGIPIFGKDRFLSDKAA